MNDMEYEDLIEYLRTQFVEMGELEIAALSDYTIESKDGWLRPSPRNRLLKMLEAFENCVALEDSSTFNNTLEKIISITESKTLNVVIIPTINEDDDTDDSITFDLRNQTDIRERIQNLRSLIASDENTRDPGSPMDG